MRPSAMVSATIGITLKSQRAECGGCGADMTYIIPVVLSGGAGSRLWPLSRDLYPKQFLKLNSPQSLLQETVLRLSGEAYGAPIIVCNEEHRFIVAEHMREIGVVPQAIVLEPVGRNTAPATAVAAVMIAQSHPHALMLVSPADHQIKHVDRLHDAVVAAAKAATKGALVTFGITPNKPETGYGYIRQGQPLDDAPGCFEVDRFVEKPKREIAQAYLDDGHYLWNSGIFLFEAQAFLDQLQTLCPEMVEACREAVEKGHEDLDFYRLSCEAFSAAPAGSLDFTVMEHAHTLAVTPVDPGWSDIGSWSALWDVSAKDEQGNVLSGDVLALDVKNSYVRSENHLVAALGLEDMTVVATDDVVLVAHRDCAQDVKKIVEQLKRDARSEHKLHTKVYRPWGWYQTLFEAPRFKVKQISVNAGDSISLQLHRQRAEHWIIVEGRGQVTCGEDTFELLENQSVYIPIGIRHRLENLGTKRLRFVEVQSGVYLGEDDIERFEDKYGRMDK